MSGVFNEKRAMTETNEAWALLADSDRADVSHSVSRGGGMP